MPDLAPRVRSLAPPGTGWAQTMLVETAAGEQMGFLTADGGHVLTATTRSAAFYVAPAFPEVARVPGRWPAPASAAPGSGALLALRLETAQPPRDGVTHSGLDARRRGLLPLRAANGLASWTTITFLGQVPERYNRTTTMLFVGRMDGVFGAPLPGTPVFDTKDGTCMGLLVPNTCMTKPDVAPLCVVAAMGERNGAED